MRRSLGTRIRSSLFSWGSTQLLLALNLQDFQVPKQSLIMWPHRLLHTPTLSHLSATTRSAGEKSRQRSFCFEVPPNANWKLRCSSLICCSNPAPERRRKRKEKSVIIHKKKNYKRGPGLWRYWALNVTRSLWSSRLPLSLTSPRHETRCSRRRQQQRWGTFQLGGTTPIKRRQIQY